MTTSLSITIMMRDQYRLTFDLPLSTYDKLIKTMDGKKFNVYHFRQQDGEIFTINLANVLYVKAKDKK